MKKQQALLFAQYPEEEMDTVALRAIFFLSTSFSSRVDLWEDLSGWEDKMVAEQLISI